MFKKNKQLKLKNYIKLNAKGEINSEDMNMLKIVFSTIPFSRDSMNSSSEQNKQMQVVEKNIKEFVKRTAVKFATLI